MYVRTIGIGTAAGVLGGFLGNGFLGLMFTRDFVRSVLYDAERQSQLFLTVTPTRDVAVSVAGLVALSALHGWLFFWCRDALWGRSWWAKGCTFGVAIWGVYWLFQEWFVYVTLLREPLALAAFELVILLGGALVEGVAIAAVWQVATRRHQP